MYNYRKSSHNFHSTLVGSVIYLFVGELNSDVLYNVVISLLVKSRHKYEMWIKHLVLPVDCLKVKNDIFEQLFRCKSER